MMKMVLLVRLGYAPHMLTTSITSARSVNLGARVVVIPINRMAWRWAFAFEDVVS